MAALKAAGSTHVLLTVLPGTTAGILGAAAQAGFTPTWLGNTPAWSDALFREGGPPAEVLAGFRWATSMPIWGEKVPGMDRFVKAYERWGKDLSPPDFYILASYIQGMIQLEGVSRALKQGDVTRAGYRKALRTIHHFTAGGMIQPVDLRAFPYVTGTWTRVLAPDLPGKSWKVVGDYAEPAALAK